MKEMDKRMTAKEMNGTGVKVGRLCSGAPSSRSSTEGCLFGWGDNINSPGMAEADKECRKRKLTLTSHFHYA